MNEWMKEFIVIIRYPYLISVCFDSNIACSGLWVSTAIKREKYELQEALVNRINININSIFSQLLLMSDCIAPHSLELNKTFKMVCKEYFGGFFLYSIVWKTKIISWLIKIHAKDKRFKKEKICDIQKSDGEKTTYRQNSLLSWTEYFWWGVSKLTQIQW